MPKALRIAIDASRTTIRQRTGTENYALQLLSHLLQMPAPHHYHFYFRDTPPANLFPQDQRIATMKPHVIPFPRMWTHIRFAAELWKSRPNIVFVPAHTLPRFFPSKSVVTVHDLGYIHFPDAHPEKERQYLDWSTRYSAHRATMVLADSEATKRDLIEFYQVAAEKIHVVYPGVDETLAPVKDEKIIAAVRQKYNLPDQYLFFLGTLQPRKNIERLVKAYAQWRSHSGRTAIGLVLGGKAGWLYQEAWTTGVEGVQLTGYIDDGDVPALYSAALALVFPSLYEGFGFPVLEAMCCDTPVIASTHASLPELAGDAALLVNPLSINRIAEAIDRMVDEPQLRTELVQKGRQQVKKFTWANAASQTLHLLEQAAQ